MAHYAELNGNNEVINVVYMDNEIITDESGNESEELGIQHLQIHHGEHRRWIRTSYRSNFRNKYAAIGDTYREDLDMFISPQPYQSWNLNEDTGIWYSPIQKPDLTQEEIDLNCEYIWSEELHLSDKTKGWVLFTPGS